MSPSHFPFFIVHALSLSIWMHDAWKPPNFPLAKQHKIKVVNAIPKIDISIYLRNKLLIANSNF